jgi:hypothetical protein
MVLKGFDMSNTERTNYLNHIRRLQVENAVLRAVVVQERLQRQAAYGWYFKKLQSRWMWIMDFWMMSMASPIKRI